MRAPKRLTKHLRLLPLALACGSPLPLSASVAFSTSMPTLPASVTISYSYDLISWFSQPVPWFGEVFVNAVYVVAEPSPEETPTSLADALGGTGLQTDSSSLTWPLDPVAAAWWDTPGTAPDSMGLFYSSGATFSDLALAMPIGEFSVTAVQDAVYQPVNAGVDNVSYAVVSDPQPAVPEPGTLALLCLGTLGLARRYRGQAARIG